MELLVKFLNKQDALHKNNVRLKAIGNLDRFPAKAKATLLKTIDRLKDNTGTTLTLALSYGARGIADSSEAAFCSSEGCLPDIYHSI